jgi:transcriptional regulator with XRE-family HTH domain
MRISGEIITAYRLANGITQVQLAKKLNISQAVLSRLEKVGEVSISHQINLHKCLGREWEIWVRKPFGHIMENADNMPSAGVPLIPVVGVIEGQTFNFNPENFPLETLYLGSKPVALKMGYDSHLAQKGEYAIVSVATSAIPGMIGIIKEGEGSTLKIVESRDMISLQAVVVGFLKRGDMV